MRTKSFEKKSGFHLTTVSKMRLVCECNGMGLGMNLLGGRPVHLSGSCQYANHFARKEDSTYVYVRTFRSQSNQSSNQIKVARQL